MLRQAKRVALREGYRVEFFWRRGRQGRWAYFQYRRGRGKQRVTRYGGPIEVAARRHPRRVQEFLSRTRYRPANLSLPEERDEYEYAQV